MDAEDVVEQTLHISREVKVYRIPPRPPTGHKSGEWKVSDEVFTGRLRVVAKGEMLEVKFEDPNTGELFAMSPIPPDKKDAYVEAVTDSSRYFVVRIEDPVSRRHAFLGMGFADRGEAFDFNVALSDHVRHCQRENDIRKVRAEGGDMAQLSSEDAKVLYQPHKDFSLKEGQTIHVSVKPGAVGKPTGKLAAARAAGSLGGGGLLAPPPPAGGAGAAPPLLVPPTGLRPAVLTPAPAAQGWTAFSEFDATPSTSDGGWAKFD
mmetsp:Transcript_32020/g.90868  ORF Transcript_32020/g.90868 Transcript_32020/m.90868 type:complete len:262 (+) Transcript_32020:234-1019(+)|eukprot:CAMPEP_0117674958 /NCGR_PEP_ID=MMETSP0804-20121206/15337_1 /TAXON_ID=1074897 /ORGANISM="Tetraselmis astigmatica, Strain CCMP880" /LENGTH=261 /DNA_ID=CAMNT_0005483905 /DNA_START=225 /DNA_END=1010 /DNA_ORIENTATION=+